MLSVASDCGLRASEVTRLRVCNIDGDQIISRVVSTRKDAEDRNVIFRPRSSTCCTAMVEGQPKRQDAGVAPERRWLFPAATIISRRASSAGFSGTRWKAAGLRKALFLPSLVIPLQPPYSDAKTFG